MAIRTLQIGDTVKFTGQFLRNTGQYGGSEGLSEWVITECHCALCKTGRFVATNQTIETDIRESKSDQESLMRHIHAENVYRVGTLDSRNA